MNIRFHRTGLAAILLLLFFATPAFSARIQILAPAAVKQGEAFPARIIIGKAIRLPANHQTITVIWLDQSIPVSMEKGTTQEARIMLPVPVDTAKNLKLRVKAGAEERSIEIKILKVSWPTEKLSVAPKYVAPPKKVLDRIAAERKKTAAILKRVTPVRFWSRFERPVPGQISSPFGGRRMFNGELRSMHKGVDLRGQSGVPIKAMASGKVVLAENMYYGGNMVYIDHGLGMISSYGHMSRIDVHVGDTVRAGQKIGLVGATGRVTGPHLHLGLNIFGQAVNPLSLFANH